MILRLLIRIIGQWPVVLRVYSWRSIVAPCTRAPFLVYYSLSFGRHAISADMTSKTCR